MKNLIEEHSHRFLPYLTSRQIDQLADKDKAVVILPVASIEQHGPHLPVYTDSIIAQEVLSRALSLLPDDLPAWFLPLLPYGKSNEHAGLAGTFTMRSEVFIQTLKEIGENVARNGFKRFAILNAHGGNSEIIDFVIRDIREATGLMVFGLHVYLRIAVPQSGLNDDEMTYGIHAGDVETSMLLSCCPELVHQDLAPDGTPHQLKKLNTPPFMGPLNFAWLTRDITPTGVLGNAQTADPTRGETYLADGGAEVAEMIQKIVEFEF